MNKLVSVITRTQNRPLFLREAIRSVATQTYPNIELVVINDGGPNCEQLIKEESTGHIQQYTYKQLEQQSGRSHAANTGLDCCNGEFIIFLDDDDWFLPEHIEKLVNAISSHPEIKVVYTGVKCADENNDLLPIQFTTPFDGIRLISGNYIPIHSALFSHSLLKLGCRIDESLKVYEDWDFWIQASMLTEFLFIDGFSAFYRNTGDSGVGLNNNDKSMTESASLILFKKWLPQLSDEQLIELSENLKQGYHKDLLLQDKDQLLQDKDRLLQDKDIQLQNKNLQLQDKNQQLQDQFQQIIEQENVITNLKHDIKLFLASTSWRVTQPLRTISHQFKRIIFVLKLIKPAIKQGGGLKNTIKKAISLYRQLGWIGIKQGFRRVASFSHDIKEIIPHPIFQTNTSYPANNLFEPRVLIIAELSIPQCTKYRVTQKQKMFNHLGVDCTVCDWTDYQLCFSELSSHSLVIFYRVPAYSHTLKLIEEAKRLQINTLWEVDDLIFKKEILEKSKTLGTLDHSVYTSLLEGAVLYQKAMLACGKTIASTIELANEMKKSGVSEVFIVENALDEQTLSCSNTINSTETKKIDDSVRIVYGSGTNTHDIDFKEASSAILHILKLFPKVKLRIIGMLELTAEYTSFKSQIERIPFCNYEEYLLHLAECDINIAPLENYVFNEAKSNIKFIEASSVKIPSICSPRSAFIQAINHGKNGFLCETTDEWVSTLTSLIKDHNLRKTIGSSAYQSVIDNYSPESIAKQQLLPVIKNTTNNSPGKLRILAVNIFYAPQPFGGATIVTEEINKILNANNEFEIFVFTSLPDNTVPTYDVRRYEIDGVSVFGLGLPNILTPIEQFDNVNVVNSFEKVLSIVKPDLVHFHSIQGIGVSIADLCLSKNIKYIITLHDAWWICGQQFMINKQGKYCNQQEINLSICDQCVNDATLNRSRQLRLDSILKKADLLLSPSQFFADLYLKNKIPSNKIVVNKNGVLKPQTHDKRLRKDDTVTFCYVGGNTEIKGIHLIKEAFAKLSNSNIKLVIVDNVTNLGFSSYDESFFSIIDNVDIVPAYTQKTIDQFFSSVDVLLFPTQCKESFGLTIREALARNVWVITTDAGGVVEDINHGTNGLIIPFDDEGTEFTKAIQKTVEIFQQFETGSEINFKTKKLTWFSDQATELAGIYKRIISHKITE